MHTRREDAVLFVHACGREREGVGIAKVAAWRLGRVIIPHGARNSHRIHRDGSDSLRKEPSASRYATAVGVMRIRLSDATYMFGVHACVWEGF